MTSRTTCLAACFLGISTACGPAATISRMTFQGDSVPAGHTTGEARLLYYLDPAGSGVPDSVLIGPFAVGDTETITLDAGMPSFDLAVAAMTDGIDGRLVLEYTVSGGGAPIVNQAISSPESLYFFGPSAPANDLAGSAISRVFLTTEFALEPQINGSLFATFRSHLKIVGEFSNEEAIWRHAPEPSTLALAAPLLALAAYRLRRRLT